MQLRRWGAVLLAVVLLLLCACSAKEQLYPQQTQTQQAQNTLRQDLSEELPTEPEQMSEGETLDKTETDTEQPADETSEESPVEPETGKPEKSEEETPADDQPPRDGAEQDAQAPEEGLSEEASAEENPSDEEPSEENSSEEESPATDNSAAEQPGAPNEVDEPAGVVTLPGSTPGDDDRTGAFVSGQEESNEAEPADMTEKDTTKAGIESGLETTVPAEPSDSQQPEPEADEQNSQVEKPAETGPGGTTGESNTNAGPENITVREQEDAEENQKKPDEPPEPTEPPAKQETESSAELPAELEEQPDKPGKPDKSGMGWLIAFLAAALLAAAEGAYIWLRRKYDKKSRRPRREPVSTTQLPQTQSMQMDVKDTTITHIAVGKVHAQGARESQQDSFSVSAEEAELQGKFLAVVADGMGGLSDGDKVSQTIVSTAMRTFLSAEDDRTLQLAVLLAKAKGAVDQLLGPEGMQRSGSTVVMGMIKEGLFDYISVGDSRIGLYRDGELHQLNRSHSYAHELLIDAIDGAKTFAEIRADRRAECLTSYIGMGELKYVDVPAAPLKIHPGDKFILMTDGVFNALTEQELSTALECNAEEAARSIEQWICEKGYRNQDNYTAVILQCCTATDQTASGKE